MSLHPDHTYPPAFAMASHTPQEAKEAKKLDISNLMSPPEVILDNFNSLNAAAASRSTVDMKLSGQQKLQPQQPLPMSPPVSPYNKHINNTNTTNNNNNNNNIINNNNNANAPSTPVGQTLKDPVLYPAEDSTSLGSPDGPLFAPAEIEAHRFKEIVNSHIRARESSPLFFAAISPPRSADYELVLSFRSQVMQKFSKDKKGWLQKERAQLLRDRDARRLGLPRIAPAPKPIAAKPPRNQRTDNSNKVTKPASSGPRMIRVNAAAPLSGMLAGPSRPPPGRRPSSTPEPSRRVVAPNREDKDFASLPDYCPPLHSLPPKPNSLKVDWKGQPIDLSNDANRHLLHPDEISLAGNLRLDCATYLTSKRRIFERRFRCMQEGREFRKTDAQQACKIDVNKASKLWTAYDKVGWLDLKWVSRFV